MSMNRRMGWGNGGFPAISVNRMSLSSASQPSAMNGWALRTLRKEKNTCGLTAIRLQPLSTVSLRELRMEKAQDTGPRYLSCIRKAGVQWAQTHIFPYIEKPYKKKCTKFPNFPPPWSSSQGLERLSPGLESPKNSRNKNVTTFRLWLKWTMDKNR